MYNTPLNYAGNKYKILNQILPLFPKEIDTFVDLFCGGGSVFINTKANKVIANDQNTYLIKLYEYWKSTPIEDIISYIETTITELQLNKTNEKAFLDLRNNYNSNKDIRDFYLLILFCFNHQIRFNNNQEFNSSFGKQKAGFNSRIKLKLIDFVNELQKKEIIFTNRDFLNVDLSNLTNQDFVYCDPPYLISNASYNDGNRGFKNWTVKEEEQLLNLLDELNKMNIKFALSNVLKHKNKTNNLLVEWSGKYNIVPITTHYRCNYQSKDKYAETQEVLIVNYEINDNRLF